MTLRGNFYARKSSRMGEKISTSITSSSSIVAPCQVPGGKCSTSPAWAILSCVADGK